MVLFFALVTSSSWAADAVSSYLVGARRELQGKARLMERNSECPTGSSVVFEQILAGSIEENPLFRLCLSRTDPDEALFLSLLEISVTRAFPVQLSWDDSGRLTDATLTTPGMIKHLDSAVPGTALDNGKLPALHIGGVRAARGEPLKIFLSDRAWLPVNPAQRVIEQTMDTNLRLSTEGRFGISRMEIAPSSVYFFRIGPRQPPVSFSVVNGHAALSFYDLLDHLQTQQPVLSHLGDPLSDGEWSRFVKSDCKREVSHRSPLMEGAGPTVGASSGGGFRGGTMP